MFKRRNYCHINSVNYQPSNDMITLPSRDKWNLNKKRILRNKSNAVFQLFSVTFYSNITALIGIAVLLNVVCMSMARERKYNSPPKFLKNAFSGYLGQLLCLGNYYHQVSHFRIIKSL